MGVRIGQPAAKQKILNREKNWLSVVSFLITGKHHRRGSPLKREKRFE